MNWKKDHKPLVKRQEITIIIRYVTDFQLEKYPLIYLLQPSFEIMSILDNTKST